MESSVSEQARIADSAVDYDALTPLQSGPILRRLKPRYGLKVSEYKRIREHLYNEPWTMEALGALQQRLKMLWFMIQDCQDLMERRQRYDVGHKELGYKKRLIIFWFMVFIAGFCMVCSFAHKLFWY